MRGESFGPAAAAAVVIWALLHRLALVLCTLIGAGWTWRCDVARPDAAGAVLPIVLPRRRHGADRDYRGDRR
jgi:hypothetical protein